MNSVVIVGSGGVVGATVVVVVGTVVVTICSQSGQHSPGTWDGEHGTMQIGARIQTNRENTTCGFSGFGSPWVDLAAVSPGARPGSLGCKDSSPSRLVFI